MRITASLLFLLLSAPCWTGAQEAIALTNPSFEDEPQFAQTPRGWENIGFDLESPPDIQPSWFNCTMRAYNGKTYVGLVVRDNNTWEAIGQPLRNAWLQKDSVYSFNVFLARSPAYWSVSRLTGQQVNYGDAAVLRVWGINRSSGKSELLAETEPVNHAQWEQYEFTLKPVRMDYDEIDLEAYFASQNNPPYNGNLLIDHCSPIVKITKIPGE